MKFSIYVYIEVKSEGTERRDTGGITYCYNNYRVRVLFHLKANSIDYLFKLKISYLCSVSAYIITNVINNDINNIRSWGCMENL